MLLRERGVYMTRRGRLTQGAVEVVKRVDGVVGDSMYVLLECSRRDGWSVGRAGSGGSVGRGLARWWTIKGAVVGCDKACPCIQHHLPCLRLLACLSPQLLPSGDPSCVEVSIRLCF